MLDRAGRGDHRRGGAVVLAQIAVDRDPVESADALACPQNRPSDGLVRPCARGQKIENEIVGRVFDGADFLHDDVFLPLEFVRIELAVGQNVAEDVERQPASLSQDAGEIAGAFDPSLSV